VKFTGFDRRVAAQHPPGYWREMAADERRFAAGAQMRGVVDEAIQAKMIIAQGYDAYADLAERMARQAKTKALVAQLAREGGAA
jgi:hypothetical protein